VGSVPVLKPREVEAILLALGFVQVRQRGSRATTVPFHGARDVSPSLLRKIARDIGLTVEQFLLARP
jgi:predicted RNA binding protein YcfA (HicA-like mRNA interferase family)